MNAVARTASIAASGLVWSTQEALAGESSAPTFAPPVDTWTTRQVEDLLRQADRDTTALMTEIAVQAEAVLGAAESRAMKARTERGGSDPVIGYRRVPHPELSKGGTCGLCLAASDRIYRSPNLRKVHGRCRCGVTEVRASHDPGGALNNLELGDIYKAADLKAAEYGNRSALSNVRVQYDSTGDLVITKTRTAAATAAPEVRAADPTAVKNLFADIAAAYKLAS